MTIKKMRMNWMRVRGGGLMGLIGMKRKIGWVGVWFNKVWNSLMVWN